MSEEKKESFSSWLREPQTMIGLAAILLSVCGLFISLYEASIMRENQQAAVWPHITIGPSLNVNSSSSGIVLFAENTGVGPAKVEAAEVTYQGDNIEGWAEVIEQFDGDLDTISSSLSLINGRVLPANSDRVEMFVLHADSNEVDDRRVIRDFSGQVLDGTIDVRICYCSVFDECWTTSLSKTLQRYNDSSSEVEEVQVVESCREMGRSGI